MRSNLSSEVKIWRVDTADDDDDDDDDIIYPDLSPNQGDMQDPTTKAIPT